MEVGSVPTISLHLFENSAHECRKTQLIAITRTDGIIHAVHTPRVAQPTYLWRLEGVIFRNNAIEQHLVRYSVRR